MNLRSGAAQAPSCQMEVGMRAVPVDCVEQGTVPSPWGQSQGFIACWSHDTGPDGLIPGC